MKVPTALPDSGWIPLASQATKPKETSRPDYSVLDDWSLLAIAEDGFAGLDTLFDRHKDYVFRLAWGFVGEQGLAEDVTQEVFLRLAAARQRTRPRAKFRTWLYQVTLNTARELRRKQRETLLDEPAVLDERAAPPERDDRLFDLERALDQLSDRQREALVLRYIEGLSTRETAEVMGCRSGTLKSHLHRAVHFLRSFLGTSAEDAQTDC